MWGMDISPTKRAAITECGRSLGVKEETIRKWHQRGVPGKWHLKLLAESRRRRLGLSPDDLLATNQRAA